MLVGQIGYVPGQVNDPLAELLKGLVTVIHGERPFTAAQRAHGEAVMARMRNNIEARQEAGISPGMTPADFALIYHTWR